MDNTTFGLRPEQEADIKNFYPTWPYVNLGSTNQSGIMVPVLPVKPPLDDGKIKSEVDMGRLSVQKLLEGDIDDFYHRATSPPYRRPDGLTGNKHQRSIDVFAGPDGPDSQWSTEDRSRFFINTGSVYRDPISKALFDSENRCVDRRFDYVLSVLESLPVGMPDDLAWELNGSVKWQKPRTANSLVYPHGPNMHINMVQNQGYECTPSRVAKQPRKVEATGTVQNVIYNVFDGVIILYDINSVLWRPLGKFTNAILPPKWGTWRDLVWHRWSTLHNAGATPNFLGDEFPPWEASPADHDRFRSQTTAGRYRSDESADLNFYQSIDSTADLPRMKSFLNYVIFTDKSIEPDETAHIQTCLQSRIPHAGRAPVFGYHETFQCGHWAFYLMLSTRMGIDLAFFLAEQKSYADLGHKMIQSVAIFVADAYIVIFRIVDKADWVLEEAKAAENHYIHNGQHMRYDLPGNP